MPNPIQQNIDHSLSDRLLFAQYTDFQVDLPPERCLDRLMGLAQPSSGWFNRMRILTQRGKTTADGYQLHVRVQHYNKGYYTSAQFDGTIFRIDGARCTLVQGKFRIGPAILVSGVIFVLFFAYILAQLFPYHPGFVLCFIVLFVVFEVREIWRAREDYHKLQALIFEALH